MIDRLDHQRLLERPDPRRRKAGPVPGPGRLHPLLRLHPDEHPADAQPARSLVAGQRGQRERRPPAPPRLRDRHDDDLRRRSASPSSATAPTRKSAPSLFGVGAGLTIDEFALWIYLDDVYWAEEGRVSIDATVIAAAAMGLILLGFTPFTFETGSLDQVDRQRGRRARRLRLVALCFAKQRLMHGTVGFFVLPVALYGAARIGKPGSPWARRRYGERSPAKQAEGRRALPARPPHRALQERLPRHRRRQAERGDRRSAPDRRGRRAPYSPSALITSRFGRRPSNSQ